MLRSLRRGRWSRVDLERPILRHTARSSPPRSFATTTATESSSPASSSQKSSSEEQTTKTTSSTTHFGFQEIPTEEKSERVGGVFASVASNYDVMNDLMSGGLHRRWKEQFVNNLNPTPDMRIVDVAGGTGDIAFRVADRMRRAGAGLIESPIQVIDFSPEMVEIGEQKARANGYTSDVNFSVGDAQDLKNIEDGSMDAYLISFGMRNVTAPELALQEAYRILRKGGRFMMLEFAKVTNPVIEQVYNAYSFSVIPALGQHVTGDRASYEYLVESIRQFPSQEAGFRAVTHEDFLFGVVAQYSGFKL